MRRYRGGVSGTQSPHVKHRPAWIAFVVLGAIFCLGMGVWQLARYREVSGTVQNLGYTFMWPFLAGFLVYAYLKYVRMEAEEGARETPAQDGDPGEVDDDEVDRRPGATHPAPGSRRRAAVMTELPADLLPTRRPTEQPRPRDEGLDAYNTYLAELARRDSTGDRSQEKPAR